MSLLTELKRRNVFRVGIFYLVLSWLVLQVADVLFGVTQLPDWSLTLVAIILALGFLPALIFAWVFEMTPEGLKRESEIEPEQSITAHTAKKLDVAVIVLLVVALAVFVGERFLPESQEMQPAAIVGEAQSEVARDATPSLAVLAFENMSADAENEYFADGISEEILNLLTGVGDLSVASRTSAFAFKGTNTPIPEIASTLKVRYVLEGSVRKAGDQVRITAQLIDADTDRHLWSDTYDRTLDDIFAIQDEIASAIGQALQVQLLGDGGSAVKAETIDPEVYARFLEARHLLRSRDDENVALAAEIMESVVEAEPQFARGHAVLGEAYLLRANTQGEREQARIDAKRHAERAASLDPTLGGPDLILGSIAEQLLDPLSAHRHFTRGIELEPNEPRGYHWRGILYADAGYLDRSVADLQRAVELEPLNPNVHMALAGTNVGHGRLDEATKAIEAMQTLNRSYYLNMKMHIELHRGDLAAAEETLNRNLELKESNPLRWETVMALIRLPADATELPKTELPLVFLTAYLGMLGHTDEYLDALNKVEAFPPGMLPPAWSRLRPEIRRDPRFIQIMERVGVTGLWRELGPPPGCRKQGESFSCGHGEDAGS